MAWCRLHGQALAGRRDALSSSPGCRRRQVTTEVGIASKLFISHSCHDGEELANLKWLVMCP